MAENGARSAAEDLIAAIGRDFEEFDAPTYGAVPEGWDAADPLDWPGYARQRARAEERSGSSEAVRCGRVRIGSRTTVVLVFDFAFLGGSVGAATGACVVDALERARRAGLPVVSVVTSGGSRVQEGILALRQLQEIARACRSLRQHGVPHITVVRHPTTGGMWAALSAAADVVLATPGADVAFSGTRVRDVDPDTDGSSFTAEGKFDTGQVDRVVPDPDTDGSSFTAEGKFDTGQVDRVVPDEELPGVLRQLVDLLHPERREPMPQSTVVPGPLGAQVDPNTGWTAVTRARAAGRPRAEEYLAAHLQERFEISGDRVGGRDSGMRCGVGSRAGRVIAYAAQTGTANTPAGFRTAARLVRFAEQLGLPVLTFVDTPGAAHDADSEDDALGSAIGELFDAVVGARVPISSLVLGEGGSGGALALAAPERTWVTPDAYFTVIAPEAAAAILKRTPAEVPELAGWMRLRPQDLVELGFARRFEE